MQHGSGESGLEFGVYFEQLNSVSEMGVALWYHQAMGEPGQLVVLAGARPGATNLRLPHMELEAHNKRVIVSTVHHILAFSETCRPVALLRILCIH